MTNLEPRTVTLEQINSEIASEHHFTALEGAKAGSIIPGPAAEPRGKVLPDALGLLTFCVLVLKNGFTVTGQSACADPAKFNAEMGRKLAREDAIRQCWKLLGFRLRDQLAAEQGAAPATRRYTEGDIAWVQRDVQPNGVGYDIKARMKDGLAVTTTLMDGWTVDHRRDLHSFVVEAALKAANGERQ